MGLLDADLGNASSKKKQIQDGASELYGLVNSIKSAIDELKPYLSGSVTESSYQKLSDNVDELLELKTFVISYTGKAGNVINIIKNAIAEMQEK